MNIFSLFKKKEIKTVQVTPNCLVSNFWPSDDYTSLWLYQFFEHHNFFDKQATFHFFSVFGEKPMLKNENINIFFTGENVQYKAFEKYKDNALSIADLSLGFDRIENSKYVRFPIWITYLFPPDSNFETIDAIVKKYNYSNAVLNRPTKFSMIASHDKRGKKRRKIVQFLKENFGTVECAGKFLNNTNRLKVDYQDNKLAYLKDVIFNVCPENSNAKGYTTEKIFEAIQCGCIPIYWGDENHPEPTILNQDAILFYQENSSNEVLKNKLHEFMSTKNIDLIPRFKEHAAEEIWKMICELKEKVELLVVAKQQLP